MARVTITIEADDVRETSIEIIEDSHITTSGGDLAMVPDVLGMAVRRAVAAVAPTAKDREEAIRTVTSYISAAA